MNIGQASSIDAELWGLRQGLFLALQLGISSIICRIGRSGDCQKPRFRHPTARPWPSSSPRLLWAHQGIQGFQNPTLTERLQYRR